MTSTLGMQLYVLKGMLIYLELIFQVGGGFVFLLLMYQNRICNSLAAAAHSLYVDLADPKSILAFAACSLIASTTLVV